MPVVKADQSPDKPSASFEIKSCQWPLLAWVPRTLDKALLASDLEHQFGKNGESPDFFDNEALLLDFSGLANEELEHNDASDLLSLLRKYRLNPVAVRGGHGETRLITSALAVGLTRADDVVIGRPPYVQGRQAEETIREVRVEVPIEVKVPVAGPSTLVIDKPLRSGQKIYAKGADLVVLAMVNQGAEVVADGNIHVYAPLRGKAMAGARGNTQARIFSICLEPELISIAGIYKTSENALPDAVRGKPAQVRLAGDELDKLLIEPLGT
jgi:septum site-determining protein MinC